MEKCEVVYAEEISNDFLDANLTEKQVLAIDYRLKNTIAISPLRRTEPIEGIPVYYSLRKARFGDYRMFLEVDMVGFVITGLCFIHRAKCYEKKNINRALNVLTREIERKQTQPKDLNSSIY